MMITWKYLLVVLVLLSSSGSWAFTSTSTSTTRLFRTPPSLQAATLEVGFGAMGVETTRRPSLTQTQPAPAAAAPHAWSYTNAFFQHNFASSLERMAVQKTMLQSPRLAIVQYSSAVALEDGLAVPRALQNLMLQYPTLQNVIGAVVDGNPADMSLSLTFGTVPSVGFQIEDLSDHSKQRNCMQEVQTLTKQKTGASHRDPVSFVLFPTAGFAEQGLMEVIDGIDATYPSNLKIGGVLSSSLPSSVPVGYIVQHQDKKSGGPQIRPVSRGLLGAVVNAEVTDLEQRWPWWQRSLIPMIRWAQIMGH